MTQRVFMVHGYNHDPNSMKHSAFAPGAAFSTWAGHLPQPEYFKYPFEWYSGLQWRDGFKAWRNGHLTSYAWSYSQLAVKAGETLARYGLARGSDVVCHSLGSRVVLQALNVKPNLFRRV
ncbi:MAG: hypothetical protein V7727_18515, partial [Sneathiella sp.]